MASSNQQTMDDVARIPPSHCSKVFCQRDYGKGTQVCFLTNFPPELDGKIEVVAFEYTINQLNNLYDEAEALSGRTCCESCLACFTAYTAYICMDTVYEKVMKKVAKFIQEQNDNIYMPRGLLLIDPIDRGLRVLEICILNETGAR